MDFALMTEPQIGGNYDELLAAARWAEQNGLVAFARSDHYYSGRDPKPDATDAFATLGGLARDTETIRLAVLVSPITFRHPAVIAKSAVTIDQMSGGRFDLGVGTGWMDLEHEAFGLPFPEWPERFARFEESLHYLTAAFGEEPAAFEGTYYRLSGDIRPKPSNLPIIIGGSGKSQTPRLAGTFADEYNHFIAPADEIAPKIAKVREAAADAGRDPNGITMSVMGPVVVGTDEDDYRANLQAAAAERDKTPEELEERWTKAGIPIGPPAKAQATLADLAAIGIQKMYVQHLDLSDLSTLDATFTALRT
ncbi:MAG: LLM class flavin-dependent oxidoreductase [Acidimicrobiia bacterium]|nr:LLM class flavin-dependent oxidoreductase [Acidimicrobiia bacterium]